jgi:hypothetical protein
MPRTAISAAVVTGPYPTLPISAGAADTVLTAADVANLNSASFGAFSRMLVIAQNTGASAYTVTFSSVADQYKRTGDITAYSLDAADIAVFNFSRDGWAQSDGHLYFAASNAAVKFACIPY